MNRSVCWTGISALLGAVLAAASAGAQNASSAANPFWGSVTAGPATDETLALSLDDAVRRGLENNLGVREAESEEKTVHGERNVALQAFLPTITLSGDTGYYQHSLAAMGFSPGVLSEFAVLFPGGQLPAGFSLLTRDTLTEGMLHMHETLFSGPVLSGWRAARAGEKAAVNETLQAHEDAVQQVATAYLRAVADSSEVDNAKANVAEAQKLLSDVHQAHMAGTATNLDELRSKVELDAEQQALIAAGNARDKELILLKRETGIAPGQKIVLTDMTPYGDLADRTTAELVAEAYRSRQDYLSLQNQSKGFKAIHAAYRSQRWPTLSFSSYYGAQSVTTVGTHGVFLAMGTVSVPIFREAGLRGGEDASQAQLDAVNRQLESLRDQIVAQIRSALLDVNANQQEVNVARSNVNLAERELSDETERVKAGVDTSLPLVEAETTLTGARTNLVESLYRYNLSKLDLARAVGVTATQYRAYLGQ